MAQILVYQIDLEDCDNGLYLVLSPSISIDFSVIMNFCAFPVGVRGKSSTNRTYLGILKYDICGNEYGIIQNRDD